MFELNDKFAVVTGAASGIGEAIARVLAQAGAKVFVGDLKQKEGKQVASEIHGEFVRLDVSDPKSCEELAKRVGHCDVLVNNAGIGHVGTILTTNTEDLDRLYAVNVKGIHHLSKVFAPGMVARKSGSIINLASVGGIVGV